MKDSSPSQLRNIFDMKHHIIVINSAYISFYIQVWKINSYVIYILSDLCSPSSRDIISFTLIIISYFQDICFCLYGIQT